MTRRADFIVRAPDKEIAMINIRLPESLKLEMQRFANSKGISLSAMLKEWVLEGYERDKEG